MESKTNLRHRIDASMRILAGESAADVANEHGVTVIIVEQWTKEFCRAGEQRLRQLPDNWLERCITSAEKLVPLATLVSVLLAVVLFVQGHAKELAEHNRLMAEERESRVRDAYSSLDDKYIDYVKLCLEQPDLDVFDMPIAHPIAPTPEQSRRESMVLSILDSLLERAYLMYSDPSDDFERNQWAAWSVYMASWAGRPNFRAEWNRDRTQFDAGFAGYMDGLMKPATTKP